MIRETMPLLRAATGTGTEPCTLSGYYTAGDGGGGEFYWDATSTEDDNGGTIIGQTGATGRWKRIYSGVVSTRWFGAKGDGIHDDTLSLQQCLTFADNIYIEKGDYNITSGLTVHDKPVIISSSPQAYLNRRFTGQALILFQHCAHISFNVNVRNSLPAVLKFNDNGIWGEVPQFRVDGTSALPALDTHIFRFEQCGHMHIHNCDITEVYGYAIFSFVDGFINFTENNMHDACYVDSCLQTWGHEQLQVERNRFANIALIPDNFTIVKADGEYPQTAADTIYGWQFGQAISILGTNLTATDNLFENISGLSIGADHDYTADTTESRILISSNTFISNSDRLRGANPPGFVWIENHQSAKVILNRFSNHNRAAGDGQFKLCRFAFAQFSTEKPLFEYAGNTYAALKDSTDDTATIVILTASDEAIINIENNKHYAPASDFVYVSTTRETRPCEYLNIQGNEVVCKEFVTGYNAQDYDGNPFKLPKQINIVNNPAITASGSLYFIHGESGDRDLELNIMGNNIVESGFIYLTFGSIKATISGNNAPRTNIIWDYLVGATQPRILNIFNNPALGELYISGGTDIYCNINNNVFNGAVKIDGSIRPGNIMQNIFNSEVRCTDLTAEIFLSENTFRNQLFLMGNMQYLHVLRNSFSSRLVLINTALYKTDFSYNVFEGNGFGIYGYDPASTSLKLEFTNFVKNTFLTDLAFNAIEFPDFTVLNGLNHIVDSLTVNRHLNAQMAICNKAASANLVISPASSV